MKKIKLMVTGIHCMGCASKIKNGIQVLESDAQTEVNVDTGEVTISFESTTVTAIKTKINEVGFKIESVEIG